MFGPIFKRRTPITLEPSSGPQPYAEPELHASHALPKLSRRLRSAAHPRILDLGNVVGTNLQFFIDLGCKVTADDFLRPVETVLPASADGNPADWKGPAGRRFEYPENVFDAAIAWDLFDFLAAADARVVSRDLHRVLKPGGIVMAYFTSRETERREPTRRFRIASQERIEWTRIGTVRPVRHVYQNRDIERMFEGFRTHTAVFLQNGTREMLLEKKLPGVSSSPLSRGSATRR